MNARPRRYIPTRPHAPQGIVEQRNGKGRQWWRPFHALWERKVINPSWKVGRYRTQKYIDRPYDLGDEHIEVTIDDCVLPYLSVENASVLIDLINAVRADNDGGLINIGNEQIKVSRDGDHVVIAAAKRWLFTVEEAGKLEEHLQDFRAKRATGY